MNKVYLHLLALFIAYCFILPVPALSHSAGQPPFFKVNGIFTDYYPVPTSSSPDFKIPQDIARGSYVTGENIEFEIDQGMLPIPQEIIQKTTFAWDFGDGQKANGLKNSHAYKNPGSYILIITAKSEDNSGLEPQLIQSMQINISPSKDYKLPKAIFKINNFQAKDPLTDIYNASFKMEFKFDGTMSEASSPITEYIWDFGDGQIGKGAKVTHKYTTNPYTVFPVLRIKTSDGFISDTFMQITDENSYDAVSSKNKLPKENPLIYAYLGILGLGVLGSIIFILRKTKKKLKKS